MMKRRTTDKELKAAIDNLAEVVPFGHLLAVTSPVNLLVAAADEIMKLRRIVDNKEEMRFGGAS